MSTYPIVRVDTGALGQSWDVLAGEITGPHHFEHPIWDQVWRWANFTPQELASEREGLLMLHHPAMDALQALRADLGRPLVITSAYRSPLHNRAEGGSKRSRHMAGTAFDIACGPGQHEDLIRRARTHGFNGIGRYQTFVHVDFRHRPATWRG